MPYLYTSRLFAQRRCDDQVAVIVAHTLQRYTALLAQPPPFAQPSRISRMQQLIFPSLVDAYGLAFILLSGMCRN